MDTRRQDSRGSILNAQIKSFPSNPSRLERKETTREQRKGEQKKQKREKETKKKENRKKKEETQ